MKKTFKAVVWLGVFFLQIISGGYLYAQNQNK